MFCFLLALTRCTLPLCEPSSIVQICRGSLHGCHTNWNWHYLQSKQLELTVQCSITFSYYLLVCTRQMRRLAHVHSLSQIAWRSRHPIGHRSKWVRRQRFPVSYSVQLVYFIHLAPFSAKTEAGVYSSLEISRFPENAPHWCAVCVYEACVIDGSYKTQFFFHILNVIIPPSSVETQALFVLGKSDIYTYNLVSHCLLFFPVLHHTSPGIVFLVHKNACPFLELTETFLNYAQDLRWWSPFAVKI